MSRQIEFIAGSNEVVRGAKNSLIARITFDRKTKVRGIHARFYAAERTEATYTTTSTDSEGNTTTQTHTAVDFVPIADQYFHLAGEALPGFFKVVGDALASLVGGGDHEVMEPGQYDFPLEFWIPSDAPASFKGQKCSVFYRMEVHIDIPVWPDPKNDCHFHVLSLPPKKKDQPILIQHPDPEEGRGFWERSFGKDINVDVALDRNIIKVGDVVKGMVHIQPQETFRLDGIVVALAGTEVTEASQHRDSYPHMYQYPVIETPAQIDTPLTHEFELPVIDLGVYTARGQKFSVEWKLVLRLDVPWAVDPIIEIPVTYLGP